MAKKQVLGRGLGEILGEVEEAYKNNMGSADELVVELKIDEVLPNPYQPRKIFEDSALKELANSIKEYGLLQPVLVYKDEEKYRLIAGERRLRASQIIGRKTIRAIIAEIDLSKLREVALIENIQREDLNPIDLAKAYEDLIKTYNLTHDDLADRIQKSRTQITNTLRLLQLSPKVQNLLTQGKITQGHAKILVSLNIDEQEKIANTIVGQKLSVRDTEEIVKRTKTQSVVRNLQEKAPQQESEEMKKVIKILKENNIRFELRQRKISLFLEKDEEIKHFLDFIER